MVQKRSGEWNGSGGERSNGVGAGRGRFAGANGIRGHLGGVRQDIRHFERRLSHEPCGCVNTFLFTADLRAGTFIQRPTKIRPGEIKNADDAGDAGEGGTSFPAFDHADVVTMHLRPRSEFLLGKPVRKSDRSQHLADRGIQRFAGCHASWLGPYPALVYTLLMVL